MDTRKNVLVQESETILNRLERLSADSIWAHRASGLRGAILREMAKIEVTQDQQPLQLLLTQGYTILNHAAKEIPDT